MQKFYALEVRCMNGTVTMDTEITLYNSKSLANKVKQAVENKNKDNTLYKVFCIIKEVKLFEDAKEVYILNN